jgi:1-pyrroline-5-carboxylate dehydrogenase
MNGLFKIPSINNEPVLSYAPGSTERENVVAALEQLRKTVIEVPMIIDNERVVTETKIRLAPPHDHQHTLGFASKGDKTHIEAAIRAALAAKAGWETMAWQDRAAIFLKAAELIATRYRAKMNAATMLAQSKTIYQAEIDCVCELVDFLRFNVQYLTEIYSMQPESATGVWNRMEYRPLEGFIVAITPFNFTAISGNLPCSPALMGNTVVWKPADSQVYSASVVMDILLEAGLPAGVINLIYCDGPELGSVAFAHPEFAGLHFTGSTAAFQTMWQQIGNNLKNYKYYPRIVGETGGKDFVIAHGSANPIAVATALTRGAFEFQGQKCSAASRAYLAESIAPIVIERLLADLRSIRMGSPEDMHNFVSAVIDERAFDKIVGYIEWGKQQQDLKLLAGGNYDKSVGYFIEPTVFLSTDPNNKLMVEEIFGPVLTLYIFKDADWEETLRLVDTSSPYALTGAVFATDRNAIVLATQLLRHSAGNFYINDKPTGAVVNQQPFGGGRASGTNDKAGSLLNLLRWVSARTIKETMVPPTDYRYPFLF